MMIDVGEDLKHEFTPEEIAARVAWFKEWDKKLDEANRDYPMPYMDDGLERPPQFQQFHRQ
jgi:hypothetical protein